MTAPSKTSPSETSNEVMKYNPYQNLPYNPLSRKECVLDPIHPAYCSSKDTPDNAVSHFRRMRAKLQNQSERPTSNPTASRPESPEQETLTLKPQVNTSSFALPIIQYFTGWKRAPPTKVENLESSQWVIIERAVPLLKWKCVSHSSLPSFPPTSFALSLFEML